MGKINEILERATQDILGGKFGKIGSRYLSIREFAKIYGVSYVTACKAFNLLETNGAIIQGAKSYSVSDCSKQKNSSNKNLLLGVHVRDISNTFYASLCKALSRIASEQGIHLIFMSSNNDNNEKKLILKKFIELNCDGVINLNSFKETELKDFYKLYPLPLVFFGINPLKDLNADFLLTDNKSSGKLAAKHLLSCGAKNFVYVSSNSFDIDSDDRFAGFKSHLSYSGIDGCEVFKFDNDRITSAQYSYLANYLSLKLNDGKIGIFCHHDAFAASVLNFCQKKNIKVPAEVAILGYDDLPLTQYTTPQISSFSYDFKDIAKSCVLNLINRIKYPTKSSSTTIFSTYLMIRNSTKSNS